MRILKVEPGKAPYAKEMEEGLKAIQREVEGLFQPLSMGDGVILCCNDEGKLNGIHFIFVSHRIVDPDSPILVRTLYNRFRNIGNICVAGHPVSVVEWLDIGIHSHNKHGRAGA